MLDPRKVQELAKERGFGTTELARRSGLSEGRVSGILHATRPLQSYMTTIEGLARALGVDPWMLTLAPATELDPEAQEIATYYTRMSVDERRIVRRMIVSLVHAQESGSPKEAASSKQKTLVEPTSLEPAVSIPA